MYFIRPNAPNFTSVAVNILYINLQKTFKIYIKGKNRNGHR